MLVDTAIDFTISPSLPVPEVCDSLPQWCVLNTRSHFEQLVYDQLVAKGFHLFLPKVEMWSRQAGIRKVVHTPLFPGYLFLHHRMKKCSYIEVRKARGLVNVLRERGDKLAVIPDAEIDSIRTVVQSQLPVLPHPDGWASFRCPVHRLSGRHYRSLKLTYSREESPLGTGVQCG